MKIDDRIEALVREALDAAVKRDIDRLDASVKAFKDEASRRAAAQLLVTVCGYVVVDIYEGHKPSGEQIRALAEQVAAQDGEWSTLAADEIVAFLHAVLGDQTAEPLDPDAGVMMMFVVTASLLAGRPMPDGKWWYNYLDQVEAAIEAAP